MEEAFNTPLRQKLKRSTTIPPSPFMKKIGFGTGVCIYEYVRSPLASKMRSPWAIKKLNKKSQDNVYLNERLKWEAENLRKLKHPNIVGFRAHLKSKAGDILAMEECTACLGNLIEDRRESGDLIPYPKSIINKVGSDISTALNYLHNTALILHCDIKSFNILIKDNFNICKLCDFGVCLPLKRDGTIDEDKAEDEYEYVGTPVWSPPEVLEFPQKISVKADIYAFGLVLQEMLTLAAPLSSNLIETLELSNDEDLMDQIGNDSLELPVVDIIEYKEIIDVIEKCTSHYPESRPKSQDLENLFKELSI